MKTPPIPSQEPPLSRGLLILTGGVFALIAVSSIAGMIAAAMPLPKSAWTLFGFEGVVAVSAALGLHFARKGCLEAPAIGLGCLAGCIGAASLLGFLSVQKTLGGVNLTPFVAFRCLAAVILGFIALVAAMQGSARSWRTLFMGIVVGIPAALGVAVFVLPAGRRVLDAVAGLGGFAAFAIGTIVFLALTASAAAGVHLIIRSFQVAGHDGDRASGA